jgi:hypothetical protein
MMPHIFSVILVNMLSMNSTWLLSVFFAYLNQQKCTIAWFSMELLKSV